jgi:hypothetical protein
MKSKEEMEAEVRLKAKIRHELKEKAALEIDTLLKRLQSGTLDARTLESGLQSLQEHVRLLPNHDYDPGP